MVHAVGFGSNATFPERRMSLGMKFFKESANRSTFEGFSLQVSGAIGF